MKPRDRVPTHFQKQFSILSQSFIPLLQFTQNQHLWFKLRWTTHKNFDKFDQHSEVC